MDEEKKFQRPQSPPQAGGNKAKPYSFNLPEVGPKPEVLIPKEPVSKKPGGEKSPQQSSLASSTSPDEHIPSAEATVPSDAPTLSKPDSSHKPTPPLIDKVIYKIKKIPPKKLIISLVGGVFLLILFILGVSLLNQPQNGAQPTPSPIPTGSLTPTPVISPTPEVPVPTGPAILTENKIAFLRDGEVRLISPDGTGEIYLVQAGTKAGTTETADFSVPQAITDFDWSPDGTQIVLVSGGDIWIVNLNDRTRQRLTEHNKDEAYQKPRWSPNGQLIATELKVTKEIEKKETTEKTISILYPSVIDYSQVLLKEFYEINSANYFGEAGDSLDSFQFVDWFPNSGEILIFRTGSTTTRGLWWLSFDKAIKERLVDLGSTGSIEADLSPNGQQVAYISGKNVWLLQVIGRDKKQAVTASGSVAGYHRPLFDHRGRRLKLNPTMSGTNQLYLAFYDLKSEETDLFWTGLSGTIESLSLAPSDIAAVFITEQEVLWQLNINTHEQVLVTTRAENGKWSPVGEGK